MDYAMFALHGSLKRDPTSVQRTNDFAQFENGHGEGILAIWSPPLAEKIKKLKEEIKAIEQANREHRKIKHPGYPAQKVYEDRRIRLVQIQQEIKALLRT
jgi:hypothetical protein